MKKEFGYFLMIGVLNLCLFTGVFKLFQNETIYQNTLGVISKNYERTGAWDDYQINKVSNPYLLLQEENFLNWDATFYACISKNMYTTEQDCTGKVRAAFFPLLPILWNLTGTSALGISLINYFLFIVSVAILVTYLSDTTIFLKSIFFSIFISLPATVSYYIPYSEALFLFTMTGLSIGLLRKKYWLYFAGSFLLSMVRPAAIFVLIAIVICEIGILITNKNYRAFIREVVLKSLPFVMGNFIALFIQYYYSGSWSALIDARQFWSNAGTITSNISDWSVEGFGLSVFAIFFICIPAVIFILYVLNNKDNLRVKNYMLRLNNYKSEYLFLISIVYFLGIFAFILTTQGGDLHSLSRYILASPPFYISFIIVLNYLNNKPGINTFAIYLAFFILLMMFLSFVDYGGDILQFSFAGMYLFIATGLFLLLQFRIKRTGQLLIFIFLILMNTIWNTYLLNIFFSNGWVFT